jgi:hypothetical protein
MNVTCRSLWTAVPVGAAVLVMMLAAWPAGAVVIPPPVRALELPPGVTSLPANDPLLAPILDGATSTTGGPVVHNQAGATLAVGKTQVMWQDLSDGTTLYRFVYLYPYGWQVLGTTNNLRVFEHNGGRHLLYDRDNRLHAIYNDGVNVWYRLGVRHGDRLVWQPPIQVNNSATPIGMSSYGTRGETFAIVYDASGNVNLQCTWSSQAPSNRSILTRRLVVDAAGDVTTGNIVHTGIYGSFQSIMADSTGRLHLGVETYQTLAYKYSDDGLTWSAQQTWTAAATGCTAYRFPNLVIDSKDRVHLLWQAESYQGYTNNWWVGFYSVRDPQTGVWTAPVNVLAGKPDWGPPAAGQQVLFAYPNLMIDDRDNLHLAWHGTARSHIYAWDDTFYMERLYDPGADTWGPWTNDATLHTRDHFNTGDGEDRNYTWVPSLAYKPGDDLLYAAIMFGLGDDEVSDPNVNLTDSLLKTRIGGQWLAGFSNVTQTTDLRSWYANVPAQVLVDPNGHCWLDMIWVDGTKDDYNVLLRRIDLGGGKPGDCNGDGAVDIQDVIVLVNGYGRSRGQPGFDPRGDLNFDDSIDVADLLEVVNHFGA